MTILRHFAASCRPACLLLRPADGNCRCLADADDALPCVLADADALRPLPMACLADDGNADDGNCRCHALMPSCLDALPCRPLRPCLASLASLP
jgi:hypothetical protein